MKKFDAVLIDGLGNKTVKTSWFCETFDEANSQFLKYKNDGVIDILCQTIEDTELSYMVFVNTILDGTTKTVFDYRNRPTNLFEIDKDTHIPVRLLQTDGFYYGNCEVQEINIDPNTLKGKDCFGSLVAPITWELMSCKDFLNKYTCKIEFEEYSKRKYGEPKLSKPAELKNIPQFSTISYIYKKCTCPIFIKENDVWIKHNDYFSDTFNPPTADIGKPTSYILKKYFNTNLKEKFVYSDNWGSVVLRSEAWLCLRNLFAKTKLFDETSVLFDIENAVNNFYKKQYGIDNVLDGVNTMSKFYENLVHTLYKKQDE